MKRFIVLLSLLFIGFAFADTINLHWLNYDGTTYQDSTCEINSDLILPSTPPTKYGYTFTGWKLASYRPIEYLESTGTQYIDTGYIPNNLTGIEIKIQNTKNDLSAENIFFGSGESAHSKSFELYIWGGTLQFIYSGVTAQSLPGANPFTVNWYGRNVQYAYNNNDTYFVLSSNNNDFISPYNMCLFADKRPTNVNIGFCRIYYCKIYDNNTLVRDFIPVLDKDGTPCMYDKVTEQFFYNQGTGQFIAGSVLQ